jgi:hypothetical protein
MRRDWTVTALCVLILGGWSLASLAEVRVVTDRDGDYRTTRVLQNGRQESVWSLMRRGASGRALNPLGDRNGDLFPTIRENRVAPYHPWVVWSRLNGAQYDLAWSRWTGVEWQPTRWIDPANASPGDDLDADLDFNETGRPFVAWWRDEDGTGRVFLSVFLSTTWMKPFAVSAPDVDGRFPSLEVLAPQEVVVRYDTPQGLVEQTVVLELPDTITDDINPLDFVYTSSLSVVSEGD